MNRVTLIIILCVLIMAGMPAAATAQQLQAHPEEQAPHRPTNATCSPTLPDAPSDDWDSDTLTHNAHTERSRMAPAPSASNSKTLSNLDWLDELDRRVTRHDDVISHALTWTQRVVGALVLLFGGCVTYLWIRLGQLAVNSPRFIEALEVPIAAQQVEQLSAARETSRSSVAASTIATPSVTIGRATATGIPRVHFLSGVIERLAAGINESRRRRGGVETGYALVGKIVGDGSSRTIIVSGLIDEGPQSARSGGHHQADRIYQQAELELLQLVDEEVMFVGDAHLHPGSLDTCSGGDYRTDLANVRASRSQEMVFLIATAESTHRGTRSPNSFYCDGLKLDFYYLGKSSDYEYRRFRPELIEGGALSVPSDLRGFAAADPIRMRLDFDNLRRLRDYRMTVNEIPDDGVNSRTCIVMQHKTKKFRVMIAISANPLKAPDVFVERGSDMMNFKPAYLNGGWMPGLMWFAPIVLDIEREITGRVIVGTGGDRGPHCGERSSPNGAKDLGPNGVDHGKLHAIEQGASRGNPQGDGALSLQQRGPGIQ